MVRSCVDHRIKPHIPPFEQIPANSVKFRPIGPFPQAEYFCVSFNHRSNTHCSLYGLVGYLILFSIHTFMYQRQIIIAYDFQNRKFSKNASILSLFPVCYTQIKISISEVLSEYLVFSIVHYNFSQSLHILYA